MVLRQLPSRNIHTQTDVCNTKLITFVLPPKFKSCISNPVSCKSTNQTNP